MMTKSLLFTIHIKNYLNINRRQQVFDLMKYDGNPDAQIDKPNDENDLSAKVDLIAFEKLYDYNAAPAKVAHQVSYQLNQN